MAIMDKLETFVRGYQGSSKVRSRPGGQEFALS
jgi:hypothetical protein